ncbi:E1 [Enhydra lutris papillomavirus 1]|uniref:Replication protein E1 n=1 Tax=Enhydra lutris papillomavirus 1 TaxID=1472717 RepID=W8S105_9PAPI|nr:E1 [Enhydra lutris papillomavirus 1]AHL83544.1 E1 [Enhydra lutris papillomavirus 1]
MADNEGTVHEDLSEWVLLEAECSDNENDDLEQFAGTSSDVSDLVDNASVAEDQVLSLQLFRQQEERDTEEHIAQLKRKYASQSPQSTGVDSLSPHLEKISITPRKCKKAKKQLNWNSDSGLGTSQYEADDIAETQVEPRAEGAENGAEALFKSKNQKAFSYHKFKESFGLSFTELTRAFQSDKTCSVDWVVCVLYMPESRSEAAKTLLQDQCTYVFFCQIGVCTLMMLSFKNQKNRETLFKSLKSLLRVRDSQLMADPPRTRSAACALYWYKKGMSQCSFTHGTLPDWIAKQTLLDHQFGAEKPFDLSVMIQWAYDNNHVEESQIAYHYALLAETNSNAAAFLNSNSQAKMVRDCATMVRYYKKAEMQRMSMSEWIFKCCTSAAQDGDWKEVVKFLRFQGIEFISFIASFKQFLRGVPKKNCLVFWGPPNTGKSMFCTSLLNFLKGKVISYVNSKSQFWLQPLSEAKIGLLDDATKPCWDYFDTYMRNALDGNAVSIDCKHKAPLQLKCPPLLVTTNVDVHADERWKYLRSRISCFCFGCEFPFLDDGSPGFKLNDESWASFFTRFWTHLELSDQEDEGDDGDTQPSLKLCTRGPP